MALTEIKVPNIGDFDGVSVIEILVKAGDEVSEEQGLIVVESDKASMEIPSSHAGVIEEILIKLGDKVSEGSLIAKIKTAGEETKSKQANNNDSADNSDKAFASALAAFGGTVPAPAPVASQPTNGASKIEKTIYIPDIGDFSDVAVIEVFIKAGDTVKAEQSLITVESDKASMEIPSSESGVIKELYAKMGQTVNKGDKLALIEVEIAESAANQAKAPVPVSAPAPVAVTAPAVTSVAAPAPVQTPTQIPSHNPAAELEKLPTLPHASPAVRKFARELGVPLAEIAGSGSKGRITISDVQEFTKRIMSGAIQTAAQKAAQPTNSAAKTQNLGGGLDLLPWPKIDFAKFGEIETKPLSRIKKISAQNLSRNWAMIPAVTYHEDADITELEAFRVLLNRENEKAGIKVTMLAFLIKASVKALQEFPEFNSSLDGDNLVLKKYFNIGFAADTPSGLVVPVVKNADKKTVFEIAKETGELAKKARDGKLGPADMQGACFTISSLGGIGGTYFAPIVNAPEVAILGVNKSAMKPIWDGKQFNPRLVLPMSLTADHRVIDGALATRFNVYLAKLLTDFRRVAL